MLTSFATSQFHWADLLRPASGILHRRRGLDEGERALVAMIAAREAGYPQDADRYAQQAAGLARDPYAIALLLEEGFPSPLTGRIGAIATAAGALAATRPSFGRAEMKRLEAQRVDLDDVIDIIATVALVQSNLLGEPPRLAA
ncbi:MAG: hypothetical protein ACK4YU_08350 [Paracoccus sp. (in: a-proteobacteria)]